jgi:hypothetical protein
MTVSAEHYLVALPIDAPIRRERVGSRDRARPGGVEVDLGDAGGRVSEQLLHGIQISLGRVEDVV